MKEHPDAWTRVDTILEFSKNQQTKYYGLQILETVIKTRWKVLPRTQCDGEFFLNLTGALVAILLELKGMHDLNYRFLLLSKTPLIFYFSLEEDSLLQKFRIT